MIECQRWTRLDENQFLRSNCSTFRCMYECIDRTNYTLIKFLYLIYNCRNSAYLFERNFVCALMRDILVVLFSGFGNEISSCIFEVFFITSRMEEIYGVI